MSTGNIRRHERIACDASLQITWKDRDGHEKYTTGKAVDVSESGLRIEVPVPLPERSYVMLRADKLGLHGAASVRSCSHKGTRFVVGLEFSSGLRFKNKAGMPLHPRKPEPQPKPKPHRPSTEVAPEVSELASDPFYQQP